MTNDDGAARRDGAGTPVVRVELDVPMTTRDGVVLRSNVYRPTGAGPFPVLLTRLPYGKDLPSHIGVLDPIAAARRGYIVVVQDVRGTFSSAGDFVPFQREREDGVDAVRWAAQLDRSSGRVGMYGLSYFGFTQLAAAEAGAAELAAIAPIQRCTGAHEGFYFRGGSFELSMQAFWYLAVAGVSQYLRNTPMSDPAFGGELNRLIDEIDALSATGYAEGPLAEFPPIRRHASVDDTFFLPLTAQDDAALGFMQISNDKVSVPSLNIGGWYDIFVQRTIEDYVEARRHGRRTRLIIGPWAHGLDSAPPGGVDLGLRSAAAVMDLSGGLAEAQLSWFDECLRDVPPRQTPPVTVFVLGENRWRHFPDWPPPGAEPVQWHLAAGARLVENEPETEEQTDEFIFDPSDPAPSVGGSLMAGPGRPAGGFDQRAVEERPDVLTYTSQPLTADLFAAGRVSMVLWFHTSAPSTDFVARLCDVHPDGRSINLADGIVRVGPAVETDGPRCCRIDLWSTANVFKAGHRIRVSITSSSFPRWHVNPNRAGDPFATTSTSVAKQTVFLGGARSSHLILPVGTLPA